MDISDQKSNVYMLYFENSQSEMRCVSVLNTYLFAETWHAKASAGEGGPSVGNRWPGAGSRLVPLLLLRGHGFDPAENIQGITHGQSMRECMRVRNPRYSLPHGRSMLQSTCFFVDRPDLTMDPLSDVLSLLQPRSPFYAGFDAAGDWSFDFPPHEGIKFTAVMRGHCWGIADNLERPIRFDEGDCFLLNSRRRFVLSSDPTLPIENGESLLEAATRDGVIVHNGGGEVFLISGRFVFSGSHADVLFDVLPPILTIPKASCQAEVLRWSLDQWARELRNPQPGGTWMSTHLAHLMLLQVLRLFLANSSELPKGWFLALTDPQIRSSITAMHAEPARNWTLEALARIAGLSRTVFAQRFKALVGRTAMDYLAHWRMLVAADRLRTTRENVAAIAFSLGYESESSFSTAFKRVMACSPTQYRRQSSLAS